jgi:dolichol-phosphate mannosyltransferase
MASGADRNPQARPPLRSFCLTLPAYNEAGAIEELVRHAAGLFSKQALAWSIVVVDDGSKDKTAAIIEKLCAEIPKLRLVRHDRNRGLGPAILTCLKSGLAAMETGQDPATHLVVCMDADLTHPPETVPAMLAAADAGADLVIASRYQPGSRQVGVPLLRRLMSFGARRLFRFYLGLPGVRDYTCGFRGFRGSLLQAGFARFGEAGLITRSGFACTDELLVHLAMLDPVIREVPFVLRYDRKVGQSKMNLALTIQETVKLLRSHRRKLRNQGRASSRG